ncbi:MAG: helix-turn-helix transcriptional regulator [Anaerolineae bacterium]
MAGDGHLGATGGGGSAMDRLLTASELSRISGLRRTTIYRMAVRGELPCVRFGQKMVRFPESKIAAWIESHVECTPREELEAGDGTAA